MGTSDSRLSVVETRIEYIEKSLSDLNEKLDAGFSEQRSANSDISELFRRIDTKLNTVAESKGVWGKFIRENPKLLISILIASLGASGIPKAAELITSLFTAGTP